MAHSKSTALPKKPRPDFPLYVHKSDRWAKKVGAIHITLGRRQPIPRVAPHSPSGRVSGTT